MPASRASCGVRKCTSLAVQEDLAGVGDQGPGQGLDQGRLAGAVVADDRQHLAREQVEVDAVEADDLAEGLDQPARRQHGLARVGEDRRRAEADGALLLGRQIAGCEVCSCLDLPDPLVDGDGDDDQDADGQHPPLVVDPGQAEADAERRRRSAHRGWCR